jgi:hypothetical protein
VVIGIELEGSMGKFLTHQQPNDGPRKGKKTPKPAIPAEASPDYSSDLSGIEVELANIAKSLRSYVVNGANGENCMALFTPANENYHPVRLSLEGEAVDKITDALSRIADALERKPSA